MAKGGTIEYGVKFAVDKTELDAIQSKLSLISVQAKLPGNELNEGLQAAGRTANQLSEILNKSFNQKLNALDVTKFSQEISKAGLSAQTLQSTLSKAGVEGATAFRQIQNAVLGANVELRKSSEILDRMAVTFKNTIRYGISSSIFNNLSNSIQKAYNYSLNLDKSLNAIRVVSGASADEMERFAEQANTVAKQLGSTTLDYTNAALIYYQQGLSDEAIVERTDVTLKMANVLKESAEDVSDYMTAIWNNFDDGSQSLEHYADVITSLGASTASSSREIAEGLSKFAAVADTVGLSYDYATTALATVVAETRQGADVVGTAFKTLFARIQGLKLGETLDDGTTLNKYSEALMKVGIQVKDASGQLKDMDTILAEMGAKWQTLAKDQQVALAQNVAGTRQYTQLVALMDNWDKFQKNLEVAQHSEGTLAKQTSIYLQSTEAHLNKLSATWEDLYQSFIIQDDLKTGADILTTLVKTMDNFVDSTGGGIKTLLALAAILSNIFNNQIAASFARMKSNLDATIRNTELLKAKANFISAQGTVTDASGSTRKATSEDYAVQEQNKKILEYSSKIQEIKSYISNETHNELIDLQNIIGETAHQIGYLENEVKIKAEKAGLTEQETQLMLESGEAAELFSGQLENQLETQQEKSNSIQEEMKFLQQQYQYTTDTVNSEKEILNIRKTIQNIVKTYEKSSNSVLKNAAKELKTITSNKNAKQKIVENEKKVLETVNKINKEEQKVLETDKKRAGAAKEIKNVNDQIAKIQSKQDNAAKEFNEKEVLAKQEAAINATTKKITASASLIVTTYSAVNSAIKIWSDETADFGEKISQTLMGAAFTIPMLLSSINNLGAAFGYTTGLLKGFVTMMTLAKSAKISDLVVTKELTAQQVAENTLKIAGIALDKEALMSEAAKTAAKTVSVKVGELDVVVTEAEAAAYMKASTAVNTFSTSILAIPGIGWILAAVAAIAAATVAVVGITAAIRNAAKATELAAAKAELLTKSKVADAAREESQAIRELSESYKTLYKQYEDRSITETEMASSAYDLVTAYGDESLAVLALTGRYEDLKEAIDEAQKIKNEQTITSSQEEQQAIKQTIQADIRKNRKESEIDKNDGGVKGWSIDLKGTNGINSKSENKLIKDLKGLGIDVGEETGHISLKDFVRVATENESALRDILETSSAKAASQLLDILEEEKEYLDRYSKSITEQQIAQKENIGLNNKKGIDSVKEYEQRVQNMIDEATKQGLYESTEKGQKDARIWAESYLNGLSKEIEDYGKVSTLSDSIAKTVGLQLNEGLSEGIEKAYDQQQMCIDENVLKDMVSEAAIEQTEELNEALKNLSTEEITAIASTENYSDQLLLLWKNLGSAEEAVKAMSSAVSQSSINQHELSESAKKSAESLDRTETGLKGYIEYIQKSNEVLKEDYELAEKVAVRQMELNDALLECVDAWEDWMDELESVDKGTIGYYETLGKMAEAFSKVFGVDLDAHFIEDNLEQLKSLINGNVDAFDELQKAAAKNYVAHMTIYSDVPEEIDNLRTQLNTFIDQYGTTELNTTLTADKAPLIDALNDALQKGKITEQQMNQYLAGIGFTPKASYTVVDGPETTNDVYLGKAKIATVVSKSKIKVPKIESITKTSDSAGSIGSFTGNTIRSATQGSNAISSGGGGSSKDPKTIDPIEDMADRYHKVDTQITKTENALQKLQSREEKFVGAKLIDNLNKQWEELNNQIDNYNQKLGIAQQEQKELANELAGKGVKFNQDGTIANYMEVFKAQEDAVNNLINRYNSLSAAEQEAWDKAKTVDNAKEAFEKFKENLDRYDELVSDFIPGIEQEIFDAFDQQVEINIQKFNMEVDLTLDMNQATRDWNEWKKNTIDRIKDEDILGNSKAKLEDLSTYFNEAGTGDIQTQTKHLNELLEELKKYDENSENVYGDARKQALEDLNDYYTKLMESLTDVNELQEEIHENILEEMDAVQDKFDEQVKSYELLRDLIDHDLKVTQLVLGDDSYGEMAKFYQAQQENYEKQLEFQRQQEEFWKNQMEAAEAGSEEWDRAREKWEDAVKNFNDLLEESLENATTKFENAINDIFDRLNNQVSNGLGLDYINTEWDLINENADRYLDTINASYGIRGLEKKYQDSINNTNNITVQQRLKKVMEEQLTALKQKDKLTQYDLDRANKLYEIELARIQLEEAQQNKSQMRLRRDSQGNYTYQYVGDQAAIQEAQDQLSNLYNDLYNFDKDRYQTVLNDIYDIWDNYQQKMAEAALINDPEERARKEKLIQDEYNELMMQAEVDYQTAKYDLEESFFWDMIDLNRISAEEFQNLSQVEKDTMLNEMIPIWTSGLAEMAESFSGDNGFANQTIDSWNEIKEAENQYAEDVKQLEEISGKTFDTIINGEDEAINLAQGLIKENEELIDAYGKELVAVQQVYEKVKQLRTEYEAAEKAAIAAAEASYRYRHAEELEEIEKAKQQEQTKNAAAAQEAVKPVVPPTATTPTTPTVNSSSGGGDGVPRVGDVVTFNSGRYTADAYGGGSSGAMNLGGKVKISIIGGSNYPRPIHIATLSGGALGWVSKSQISGYDTGGYTGTWNNNGRLAVLHQKELVLNAEDTENMLNAVSIMRSLANSLGSGVLARLAGATAQGYANSSGNGALEQNVHIDAQFPNVRDALEIEQALNNLVNVAAQRIYEK